MEVWGYRAPQPIRSLLDSVSIEVPWIGIVAGIVGQLLRIKKRVQAPIECFVKHSRRTVEEGKTNKDHFNAMLSRHFSQSIRVLSLQGVVQCIPRGWFVPSASITVDNLPGAGHQSVDRHNRVAIYQLLVGQIETVCRIEAGSEVVPAECATHTKPLGKVS